MTLTLRDYQEDAVTAVLNGWQAGRRHLLVVMATGLGKTAVFLTILDRCLTDGKRGLILAHRKELIDQPLDRLYDYYPRWRGHAGIVMAETNQPDQQITVATVQTLSQGAGRLDAILAAGKIDYLIVDEAHHATADTYQGVRERLLAANPELCTLGVTATPVRADGDGLIGAYDDVAYVRNIVDGIGQGALCPVRFLAIQTKISLDGVKSQAGDFVRKQLASVFETDDLLDLVVSTHQLYAADRQAAAFSVSVEGAHRLAEKFNQAGIAAEAADGTTDKKLRAAILQRFSRGETQVLCNVGLYTEGLDVPQISCIHQARPTRSDSLYTQIIGRALRTYPGKTDALILDYAPASTRNITMAGDILGVPLDKSTYLAEEKERGEAMGGFVFDGEVHYMQRSPAEIISRQLHYLDLSPWSWWRAKDGWMSLGLGKASDGFERTLLISPLQDGKLTLFGIWRQVSEDNSRRGWQSRAILESESVDVLLAKAEELANKHGQASLAGKARDWRSQGPTDAQLAFARRIGAYRSGMSKGELAQSITHRQALLAVGA